MLRYASMEKILLGLDGIPKPNGFFPQIRPADKDQLFHDFLKDYLIKKQSAELEKGNVEEAEKIAAVCQHLQAEKYKNELLLKLWLGFKEYLS